MVLTDKLNELKKRKNALILAHYYQNLDIQLAADFVGDSFELSKRAKEAKEELVVFCGVKFMAESAKLLSPQKTVLLPQPGAGCPMADMAGPELVKSLKRKHPGAAVMCYVNSSAATKAECDVCCTSSNAVEIAKKTDAQKIIFVPDKNLGSYVAGFVPEKEFVFAEGWCPIHKNITKEETAAKKLEFPKAKLAMHPECDPEAAKLADFVGSTSQIIGYCQNSGHSEFLIGTERGVAKRLRHFFPGKTYHMLSPALVCPDMKKTAIEDVFNCLADESGEYSVDLPEEMIKKAKLPLERMLEL
ncbi:MAG: quinolinate synthase NadA [Oscillospiraceae bacterium]|nr:quinolinate synthase NadA [Oscillospiraceae bacterium]